jgi:hypothetical protein
MKKGKTASGRERESMNRRSGMLIIEASCFDNPQSEQLLTIKGIFMGHREETHTREIYPKFRWKF